MRGEVDLGKPKWLPKHSAVNLQGLASVDWHVLERKLGNLNTAQYRAVKEGICELLQLRI